MIDLVALARARGLEKLARRLGAAGHSASLPSIDALPAQPIDVPTALGLMRRRGLEPGLIKRVLVWLADRPLELGLFSWDALSCALLGADDAPLLGELRKNALRVRPLLPAPASTFVHSSSMTTAKAVETFTEARHRQLDDDPLTHAAAEERSLVALDELRRRHGIETLADGGIVDSTVRFSRLLHLSHMSTLASLYADYAFRVLKTRTALPEFVEILLDVGATESLPPPSDLTPDGTVEQLDLLGYAAARAAIVAGNGAAVLAQLQSVMKVAYDASSVEEILKMPRSHVVFADAAAEQNKITVPFPILDQIAGTNPEWRYAHRVRAIVSALAQETPDEIGRAHV